VLKLWEGLGYYSRARNLQRAAKDIVELHGGVFPLLHEDVRALPGVGPYTAGAIMSVAYNAARPAVDANVERVFSRLFDIDAPVNAPAVKRQILAAAWELLPPGGARAFNQALMELGALVCGPRRTDCADCPVAGHCLALARGTVVLRPLLPAKKEILRINMASGVLVHKGRIFVQKRRPDDVWPGLWEFPGGCMEGEETPEQALVREFREETELKVRPVGKIAVVRYSYTRYRVTLHGYFCEMLPGQHPEEDFRLHEATEGRFALPEELAALAFPSGHARLLAHLRADLRYSQVFGA
jgi:A/G-specific adenine glycosylase